MQEFGMLKHTESLISAHHNYLVNDMLSPGFLLGDPDSKEDFYFLADVVPPDANTPLISGRLFNKRGELVVEIERSELVQNPGECTLQSYPGGFRLLDTSGETLLNVVTQVFTNGYLTRIQGKLFDRSGKLRAEPSHEGIRVQGEANLALGTSGERSR